MRFNPPPGWPVPEDWSPTPEWSPDPAWPPAPPGWVFWVEDDAVADATGEDRETGSSTVQFVRRWKLPLIVVGALGICAVVVLAIVQALPRTPPLTQISTLPHTATMTATVTSPVITEWTLRPDWPSSYSQQMDFTIWDRFGDVDAKFSDYGRSVVLDTHDTIETWRTKWSGLSRQRQSRCDLRIAGRVRDISHTAGVPGGFGIGLGTLGPGDPATAELSGTAIQFDFGLRGYRVAFYPDDAASDVVAAPLDNQWHDIEVTIDTAGHTLVVDGRIVLQSNIGGQCGQPILRVWAGSAEFADFSFLPS